MVQAEMNLYLSLQSHFYVKYKKWKHNQQTIITVRLILTQALENDDEQYSGISIKRTPLVQKMCPLYRDVHFIEIFSEIVWPKSKAIRSSPYCSPYRGVRFIVCPLYRDSTVF